MVVALALLVGLLAAGYSKGLPAAASAPGIPYRLEFRSASKNDVNAMALPRGIILLDGLVEFAGDEDAVLGVLGHELGHVAHRYSTRQILQSAGAGAVASLLWGARR